MLGASAATAFVICIGLVSLFSDMTYEGGRSLTGQVLQLLGSSALAVGIAAGAGEFLGYALRFASGYAADRTGAYWRITLIGYAIQLFALPLLSLVDRWEYAVGLIFLERMGKGIRQPTRDAMLSYATKEMGRGWGYGINETMDQIGALTGPLLMALVLGLGVAGGLGPLAGYQSALRLLFIPAAFAFGVLAFARLRFPQPRDLESRTPKVGAKGLGRRYWLYVLATGLVGAGFTDFALIAFHIKRIALVADQWIPVLFATGALARIAVALYFGKLYDRNRFAAIFITFGLSSIFAPFVFLGSLPLVVVGVVLWAIGLTAQGSIMRAALADVVPTNRRAYGFGLFALAFGVFWFAGSALMGFLYDQNVTLLVVFSTGVSLLALPVFWLAKQAPEPATG